MGTIMHCDDGGDGAADADEQTSLREIKWGTLPDGLIVTE